MAQAYGAVLCALAASLVALRGVITGELAASVLQDCLMAMAIFFSVGYVLGYLAELVLRQSAEVKFRTTVNDYLKQVEERKKESGLKT